MPISSHKRLRKWSKLLDSVSVPISQWPEEAEKGIRPLHSTRPPPLGSDEAKARRERADDFIAKASHALTTPLTAIIAAADALRRGAVQEREQRASLLDGIVTEGGRVAQLAQTLFTLAKLHHDPASIDRQRVEVGLLLEEIARRLEVKPGVRVVVSTPPGLAVRADHRLLELAVENLAENAARSTDQRTVLIAAAADDAGDVAIRVSDTGSGILPELRERVFELFFSGEAGGFGLGLPLVREVVDAHGGALALESGPGGTSAAITLARVA